ncbi:CopD family protein [Haloplanus halophilus]|uniref:CopD family protein n=1 Tax=Haloplanus halophilus TaxID=2949993 RepID=UPI00203EC2A7|nr:CopD family protein [Haloplanus sp. GDY1]
MVPLSHLLVRWLHLLAMAVALGGTALAWWVSRTADATTALVVAGRYEGAFWGALGVLAMTGVGNLGALAPAIPRGPWGAALVAKLGLVLAVLVGSAVRTATVVAARDRDAAAAPLERAYALTAVALVAVVGLAEVLAHG